MRINEDFIKEREKNECVLVPTGGKYQNGVFKLNETAERIYDLLCEGKTREGMIDVLASEYETKKEQVAEYVDAYIAQLKIIGVVLDD